MNTKKETGTTKTRNEETILTKSTKFTSHRSENYLIINTLSKEGKKKETLKNINH